MSSILIVFRSRAETMNFSSYLKDKGVKLEIINTPKEANVGCGLSIKIDYQYATRSKVLLKNKVYQSFVGFYKMYSADGKIALSLF